TGVRLRSLCSAQPTFGQASMRFALRSSVATLGLPERHGGGPMAVYIIKRHMSGGSKHEHIAEVEWENRTTGDTGKSSRANMVKYIEEDKGDARVANGSS